MQNTELLCAIRTVSRVMMCWLAVWGPSDFYHWLQERLLSERWGNVSLHIGKHPLQQDPQRLLEGSTAQDVHGGAECHPDVCSPHAALVELFTRLYDQQGYTSLTYIKPHLTLKSCLTCWTLDRHILLLLLFDSFFFQHLCCVMDYHYLQFT